MSARLLQILAVVGSAMMISGCAKKETASAPTTQRAATTNPSEQQGSHGLSRAEIERIEKLCAQAGSGPHWMHVSPLQRLEIQSGPLAATKLEIMNPQPPASLMEDAQRGDFRHIVVVSQWGVDLNLAKDLTEGASLLHWAAYWGNTRAIKALIAGGANVNARTNFRRTPLHWAVEFERDDAAAMLIAAGADFNAKDRRGMTPLDLAAQEGKDETSQALLSDWAKGINDPDSRTWLHWAAMYGQTHVAELLLDQTRESNLRDKEGRTPLHVAVASNRTEMVGLLLRKGADPEAKDPYGLTPLFEAKSATVAEMLLMKGAKVMDRDQTQQTPLHWAAAYGRQDVARLLIEKGADLNARDKFGRTPLDVAKEEKQEAIASLIGDRR